MKNLINLIVITAATLFGGRYADSATIYQWTDADGVVHFSDVLPANHTVDSTREIVLDEINDSSTSEEKYSIIEQANLMAGWRQQTTAERIALKRLYLEEQRLARELELQRQESQARIQNYQSRPHYYVYPQPYFYRFHNYRDDRDGNNRQKEQSDIQQSFMRQISRPQQPQTSSGYLKTRIGF